MDEFGAAEGVFAKYFLDSLRERAPDVYERTEYNAWDYSPSLQERARQALAGHARARVGIADVTALGSHFASNSSDAVFCHELFDDLPARVVWKLEGALRELGFARLELAPEAVQLQTTRLTLSPSAQHYQEISEFMQPLLERVRVTFTVDGEKALCGVHALLKRGGMLRVSDYGFAEVRTLLIGVAQNLMGKVFGKGEMLEKGYYFMGGDLHRQGTACITSALAPLSMGEAVMQATTLVNFPFLAMLARAIGFQTTVEHQLAWASRVAGEPYVMPSHCAHGVAYQAKYLRETAGQVSPPVLRLASTHKLFADRAVAEQVMELVRVHGETEQALHAIAEHFEGILPTRDFLASRAEVGREGFVKNTLRQAIAAKLAEPRGLMDKIRLKAKREDVSLELIPESSEAEHWRLFEPEIRDLLQMGFDEAAVRWALFATPEDRDFSGSHFRLALTATKQ